jgi:RND family efflux transporter MFP subunit
LATLWVPEIEAETALKAALVEQAEADWKQAQAAETVARSRVTSAEAKVAEAKAGISRADAEATRWDAEYVRVSQLIRASATSASLLDETRSKQVAAQAAREEVRAQVQSADAAQAEALAGLEKAQADVIAAAARVEVAKYDLQRAEAMASYARIEAPFDGIVTRRNVDTGHLTRIYTGTEGTPLFVVARADVVSVVVGIPEPAAPWVDPGDPAQVRVQALGNRTFDGKVSRIAWALDNVNRTLMIEIDLPSQDGLLRPGLYAYATISAEEHSDAWTIPLSALIREGDRTYCVVVSQGKASRREVALGITDGPRVEVLEGLEPDDEIVKANAGALLEGQAVEALRLEPDRPPN